MHDKERIQTVLDSGDRGFRDDSRKSMRLISHHEEEWQLVSDRMRSVIMSEFCQSDMLCPGSGVGAAKDLQICFNFLVDLFSFSISFRVICCREGKYVSKMFSEFLSLR